MLVLMRCNANANANANADADADADANPSKLGQNCTSIALSTAESP
ncbi:hypothetical protein [Paenibacillus sonchi]|nr:hypothetical protein [Paenibacillus sonchi]